MDETAAAASPTPSEPTVVVAENPADLAGLVTRLRDQTRSGTAELTQWIWTRPLEAAALGGLLVVLVLGLMLLRRGLCRRLRRGKDPAAFTWQGTAADLIGATTTPFLIVVATAFVWQLIPRQVSDIQLLRILGTIIAVAQGALWIRALGFAWINRRAAAEEGEAIASGMSVLQFMMSVVIWLAAGLFLMDNLGVDITSLLAGLGIGGLAIGLAAQGLVADLFAALSIIFAKPFRRGDYISSGEISGTVESVGLGTSRLRAVTGELLIVPNNLLLENRIQNYRQMPERVALPRLTLDPDTPPEGIEAAMAILRQATEAQPDCRFDRVTLIELSLAGPVLELVFGTAGDSFVRMVETRQRIFLRALSEFQRRGIRLARNGLSIIPRLPAEPEPSQPGRGSAGDGPALPR